RQSRFLPLLECPSPRKARVQRRSKPGCRESSPGARSCQGGGSFGRGIFASVIGSARLGGTNLDFYPLQDLGEGLPMTVKVLLEGLIRLVEAGVADEKSITALAHWPAPPHADAELPFLPARVLMQ